MNALSSPQRWKKLFPELTEKQFLCLFYYSIGFNSKRIGTLMHCEAQTIRNQIQILKQIFYIDKASDLRAVLLLRIFMT
ncbi:hypothetical protein VSAL_p840_69 (plasmid) [Aliivibrio salmonicida LFI1238]|uniref:HTH luxR-type domain-containing protein n=1 Tax=Aliivibrio salmonicida (strain LFI1238) TaxID=316275 RepID=B6ET40_ALISL|nr:hypothetical protein [Aliivibrio salmonicida]CAQ81928.1 hypothetical protein VSAL_p840_69 [Aliivibrio salmonicida LFI1238]